MHKDLETSPSARVASAVHRAAANISLAKSVERVEMGLAHIMGIVAGAHAAGAITDEEGFEHGEYARRLADKRRDYIWSKRNDECYDRGWILPKGFKKVKTV